MKRIFTTVFVLASTSVSGIAMASHYDDRYDSRYDNRYYDSRYDDRYSQDDWYYDSNYNGGRYYDSRYDEDTYYDNRYNDEYRYRSSSSTYRYSSPTYRPSYSSKTIEIRRDFMPEVITVKAGTTVTWVNRDYMPHTVRSDQRGIFSSAKFYEGQRYSVTFLYPGTFDYHCSLHPGMMGTVRVLR